MEHGSLDILSLMKQYGHGSENYRLMALIRLAQLSQGTYNTKENITKVEDEEDRTQKVLTNLKEAKDNAGEFLEITGKFLLSQLPEPFKDIVMFCGGFSNRVLTNVFPGSNFMNEPYQETLLIPYTKGAIVGDLVSMVAGVLTTIIGGSMVVKGGLGIVIGTAATATGVGTAPGIEIDGASAGLIIEGVAVASVGIKLTLSASKNIGNDLQKLQEAKNSVNSEIEEGSETGKNGTYEKADYHGKTNNAVKNKAPNNGQEALDNSVSIGKNTTRRVGISDGEIVVFDETTKGVFHGHVRSWSELSEPMKAALKKAGMVTKKGRIIK